MSTESLRSLVVSRWAAAGRPAWDLARTTEEAEAADRDLAGQGANPAPAFRARRLADDRAALKIWTNGCRFEWLGGGNRAARSAGSTNDRAVAQRAARSRGPKVPGRMTPSFAFGYLERAIQEGLGRRAFRIPEVERALAFFGEPLTCVFCGSEKVTLWEHLVPVARGGETVLGNMVPACQPCNDSKHSKPYDEWLMQRAAKNPDALGAHDVAARIAHLREYAEKFQYVVTTPESRLDAERLLRVEELRLRAKELRADVEAFLREPDA